MPELSAGGGSQAAAEFRTVLFVCTGNAGRSQMAEALFRRHLADHAGGGDSADARVRIASAGVDPWPDLHPMARHLMAERGLDLAGHYPKSVARALHLLAGSDPGDTIAQDVLVDVVVTLGDPARAHLPRAAFGAAYWLHWDIGDPADADGTASSESVFRAALAAIERLLPNLASLLKRAPALHHWARCPGISTGLWDPFDPARHLPLIAAAGFRAIELNLYRGVGHFDASRPANLRQLRQVADDLGLVVWSIHSPEPGAGGLVHPLARRGQPGRSRRAGAAAPARRPAPLSGPGRHSRCPDHSLPRPSSRALRAGSGGMRGAAGRSPHRPGRRGRSLRGPDRL